MSEAVQQEEANAFAAFILMPSPHFERAVRGIDWLDDDAVRKVAKRFQVTLGAVHYRQLLNVRRGKRTDL